MRTMPQPKSSQSERQGIAGRYSAVLESQETLTLPGIGRASSARSAAPSQAPVASTLRAMAPSTSIGKVQLCKQYGVEQTTAQSTSTAHTSHGPAPSENLRVLLYTASSLLALDLSNQLSSWGCAIARKEDPRSDYDVVLIDVDTITGDALREATCSRAFQASRVIALSDDDPQHIDGAERCMPSYEWDALRKVLLEPKALATASRR